MTRLRNEKIACILEQMFNRGDTWVVE